jgi:hypothetical protein
MKNKLNHLFAFVSEQAIDAVSVLFDDAFDIQHVTLVGLKRDMHKAQPISRVLKDRLSVQVEMRVLPTPRKPAEFIAAMQHLIRQAQGRVAINLNTDDAVCACLALEAAQQLQTPVFAVETQFDRLVWLSANERLLPAQAIDDKLHCLDVFEMHGFSYIHVKPVSSYAEKLQCAAELLPLVVNDETFITRCLPRYGQALKPGHSARILYPLLGKYGLAQQTENKQWQLVNEDALHFIRGNWLEFAVFDVVTRLAKPLGMVDWHRAWQVRHQTSGLVCEFDIVFMLNNELHIIECKSGDSRGGKFLSHFEGMTRSHGLRARTMLVSVDELSSTLLEVANGLGTATIHGVQLLQLSKNLEKWMRNVSA